MSRAAPAGRRAPALAAVLLSLLCGAARAHSPHDVLTAWAISPGFERDQTLFVGASRFKVLLRSTDGGRTFTTINAGLDTGDVHRLAISRDFERNGLLVCAEPDALYRTRDAGDHWTEIDVPPALAGVRALALLADDVLLAGSAVSGCWRSTDLGETWTRVALGEAGAPPVVDLVAAEDGRRVLAFATDDRVFVSRDAGERFTRLPTAGVRDVSAGLLGPVEGLVWLGTQGRGVLATRDGGASWHRLAEGLTDPYVQHLASARGADGRLVLFAATNTAGVFVREGEGPWTLHDEGLRERAPQTDAHYLATLVSPAYPRDGLVYAATFEGLHVSRLGEPWRHLDTLPPSLARDLAISPAWATDRTLFLSTYGAGLVRTTDGGRTWRRVDDSRNDYPDGLDVSPAYAEDATVALGIPGRLRVSTDGGRTWEPREPTREGFTRVVAFAPDFATSRLMFVNVTISGRDGFHGFYRSEDAGGTWTPVDPPQIYALAFPDDWAGSGRAWAATPNGLYASRDRGASWAAVESCPESLVQDVAARARDGSHVVLVAAPGRRRAGVLGSTDGGQSWAPRSEGLAGHRVTAVAFGGADHAFAATHDAGVFVSRDDGASWTPAGRGPRTVFAFGVSDAFAEDGTLVATTYEGAWISEDRGASWRLCVPRPDVR